MKSEKGGITVFLAVIFMALLVCAGSLTDIARIAVAERRIESALSSSVRSLLADYDADLIGAFGMFGRLSDPDAMREQFMRYFGLNLKERHEGLHFIRYDIQEEELEVEALGSLTDKDIFRRQVLEYMKYKAPAALIENTAESINGNIIAKFKKAKLGPKIAYAEKEKTVRVSALELEEKLGGLNDSIGAIRKNVAGLTEDKLAALQIDIAEILEAGIPQSGEAYEDYADARRLSDAFLEERDPEDNLTNREAGIEPDESVEFEGVEAAGEEIEAAAWQYKKVMDPVIREITPLRAQIDSLQEQIDEMQQSVADLKKRIKNLEKKEDPPRDMIHDLEDRIDDYLDRISPLEERVMQKEQEIEGLLDALRDRLSHIPLEQLYLKEDSKESPKKHPESAEEKKRGLGSLTDEIGHTLASFNKHIEPQWLIGGNESAEAGNGDGEGIQEMKAAAMAIDDGSRGADCEKSYDNMMGYIMKMREMAENGALKARDKLYIIEYAMDKFTFLTSKTVRDHYFTKGEVEYLLAGGDSPYRKNANYEAFVVADVLSRVWFLRFAIDAVDGFATTQIPHPLARLAWALTEGAAQACADMLDLLKGQPVGICPSCQEVRMLYSDHLRLLLLMQDEDTTVRRMQQLVQVNIKNIADARSGEKRRDFRLSEYRTVVRAEAEVCVNLWFLPVLHLDKAGFKQFEGEKYILRKEVYIGY